MERMKKLREKLAEKAGFTLVELIVVIAILGILAAIAVPTYTGYISRARQANDLQVLSSVATAVVGVKAADGTEVTTIQVSLTRDSNGAGTAAEISYNGTVSGTSYSGGTALADADLEDVTDLLGYTTLSSDLAADFSNQTDWTVAIMSGGEWTLSTP